MWTSKKSILSQIRGDPTGITNDLKECLRREWLEKEFGVADSGQKYDKYRRIDMPQTLEQFKKIMKGFEDRKQFAIDEIKQMKYCITTPKTKKITKKGKDFLSRVQSELLDMAFMITIRLKYQGKLKIEHQSLMNERVKVVEKYIDGVMKELELFKSDKIIQEYFQNHTHQLTAFKI
jgi:hypothetical protein